NPRILDAVEDVIGPDILLFGASIFAKDARDPRYVSWHQDSAYFGLDPHEEVTAWVGFTESTIEKGCLKVMPRTHLGPDLQPGEFSLHHERMAHASEPNRGADRRIGFAFFYIPTHVRSTIGRRQATLVRGVDEYGHWDPDQEPRFDLDPRAMQQLTAAWDQYKDGEIRQAADMGVE